jgi:hypothetical protein
MSNRRKIRRDMLTGDQVTDLAVCRRCGKRYRDSPDKDGWNVTLSEGQIVAEGFTCPACQTPEENTEAEINLATLDYGNKDGLITGKPRV